MSAHNKVLWSEGLFLQPQHFQQQDRYLERYVEARCQSLVPHGWGFSELAIDTDLLSLGKFGVRRAAGVFPDGTPFRMPDDDPLPDAIDVGPQVRDQIVHLALPLRRGDLPDVDRTHTGADGLSRYSVRQWGTRDVSAAAGEPAVIEVGALRTRLLLASERAEAYACVPLAHIVECRPDKHVALDDGFIPTVLRAAAANRLAAYTMKLAGMLHQRGEALAGFAASTHQGEASQIEDYLILQAINRYEPLLAHFNESRGQHPEELYRVLISMAGEMATYLSDAKRPPALATYQHDRLRQSFEPVMAALDQEMGRIIRKHAVRIPVETRKHGISVALVADRALYTEAVFVLAAKADVATEELRRRFPAQLKVGPVEKIGQLVNLSLPGVPVHAVPVAPRAIPYHAGFAYFELDQTNELWAQLPTSGGVGMHVAGEFPGLALEFWAIRA
jgi:type VI secretion system protein ImpJ